MSGHMVLPVLQGERHPMPSAGLHMQMSSRWVPGRISGSSPLKGIVVWINSGVWEHLGTGGTGKGSWSFSAGSTSTAYFKAILAKHHQAFDRLMVRSQGAGDVLGTTLDVALGPLSHLFLQLDVRCAYTSGLFIAV